MMPNVEIEVPIGKRWSVNGEYMFPWWLLDGDKYSLQILTGGLEGRYWLGSRKNRMNREVLTGHFLGLYAGGGKYDLQWKENGYQDCSAPTTGTTTPATITRRCCGRRTENIHGSVPRK